ncbi:nitrite reductase large subunit NirB [Kyrpidia tusciae]|uniref:Nitrite reductase (NAD(P)H), large subunit n=1 Tax=Kyrpidia tusciae (strain DSM 2912 / NBRC 15312 / T2) TaxID=562970 RepID=D5WXH1_KYRT2|nr:nitrite reductase large subunit NirB [Kyrpidia tusciae]ADG05892.1 nitrite reductase (NAD(P)H), large subunit [Kyrpidia tusciae DSM 2912]
MSKKKLVLVGNGMAGIRCIEEILAADPEAFDIIVFGAEPHPNYNRILLSSVLAGDTRLQDIVLNDWSWYEQHGITLYTGHPVSRIDIPNKRVCTSTGIEEPYDELILATGSLPILLPVPGSDKEGVIAFRNIEDCRTMIEASKTYSKAVVIGGGLLGLEAARGLLHLSMDVSVVHLFDCLMERQLDPTASKMLQAELERQGMRFLMEKQTAEILGDRRVTGVRFSDGTEEPADLVVMAVGIRPNTALAKEAGIAVNRGIVVDDELRTSEPNVYAVGECAEHRGVVYGLVQPLYEQARVLALSLCGRTPAPYTGSVTATKLKVSGVDVFSAGEFLDGPDTRAVRIHDEMEGIYKKVLVRGGKVTGAVLFGDTRETTRLVNWIREGVEVSPGDIWSLLSVPAASPSAATGSPVTGMSADEIVCGCNGVTKGAIVHAIEEYGLKTVEEIKAATHASRSCGGCRSLVQQILESVLGSDVPSAGAQGICPCTTLSREVLIEEIRAKHLTNVKEVMNVLGWANPDGCSKCRPALNYYLSMLWPEEHADDPASRFVNERLHANIQKDGTYSVVPRMYGGVTTPGELRRIAEVAEKYGVKMVKITGGQRIDLLGVGKQDLPRIWEDLGMPSGYAYGKAIRTVKTCVGTDFCRFGTQNSIGMGIQIEKRFERLNTPAKVKMAVSGCPRNCAEATVKDLGVVGIEGGWEIYVGGNGGVHVRKADLLCKVITEEEVLEIAGAYLQYYRETAHYGERTSQWVERVGLDGIRQVILDPQQRSALVKRLEQALAVTTDPWKTVAESPELQRLYQEIPVAP